MAEYTGGEILTEDAGMRLRSFFRSVSVLLIAGLVLSACAFVEAQSNGTARFVPSTGNAGQLPAIYQGWLNEDVVYIITPEEKEAFLKLKTTVERDHFITQFWLRRDPTPDTEENEYKEETTGASLSPMFTSQHRNRGGRPIAVESTSCTALRMRSPGNP